MPDTYRGSKGLAVLGGRVTGTALTQGAVAEDAEAATIDGSPLTGVVRPGDTFTVAGDGQEYTVVTGGVVGSSTSNELAITFTPGVQVSGGWADNAEVSFVTNSVAKVQRWRATPSRPYLETTGMGDDARTGEVDIPEWEGEVEALFDYGDPAHADFIDEVIANGNAPALAVLLAVADGKNLWGDLMPSSAAVQSQRGAIVTISFTFEGEGALSPDWN